MRVSVTAPAWRRMTPIAAVIAAAMALAGCSTMGSVVGDPVTTGSASGPSADSLSQPMPQALAGTQVGDVEWPEDTSLVTIIRGTRVLTPSREDSLEAGDELLFVAAQAREEQLEDLLSVRRDSTAS